MPRDRLVRARNRGLRPANPLAAKRHLVVPGPATDLLILGLLGVGFYVLSLLPPFRLSAIEVQGAQRLNPAFVVESVKQTMAVARLGLFPQSSYFYLNAKTIEQALRKKLQPIVPLSELTVTKRFPKKLIVQLAESRPAAAVVTTTTIFLLDHNGIITGPGSAGDDQLYPSIHETNAIALNVGDQLLSPSILAALPELRSLLEQRNLGPVSFATPEIHCTLTAVPEPVVEPMEAPQTQNTNTTVNADRNRNAAIVPPAMVESVCDVKAELTRSTELTVVTGEGWEILLDTAQPIGETMDSLFLALKTKLPSRTSLRQVDLRFPPKLFYQ